MRITHGMVAESTLRNIQRNFERTEQLQNQITSGSRIARPSDDPIGVAQALDFQQSIEQGEQFLRNIDQASAWLLTTDSALDAVGNLLQRTRELAVQGANETLSPGDRATILTEVEQLQEQALRVANSKYGTRYIFAGTRSSSKAYTDAYAYQGDTGIVQREVGASVTLSINVVGSSVFSTVFEAYQELRTGLASSSGSATSSSLTKVDAALETVLQARAEVGSKVNRLEFAKGRQEEIQVNLSGLLSIVKDVDMAEAITNFSVQESVYKASLQAAGRALQPSLLDYMR